MDSTDIDNSLEYNMNRYEEGVDELADINSGMFSQDNLLSENEEEEEEDPDDVIILHMDIREPLSHLKVLLEDKVDVDLANFEFTLQDAQILEPHKNLVDQCLKGEGLVQINVQVRANKQRINVVDVLKPTDDALAEVSGQTVKVKKEKTVNIDMELELTGDSTRMDEDEMANWVIDTQFQKDQTRLKIPEDPVQWTQMQVKYWLQWAIKQFQLSNIKLQEWAFSGKQLCSLSLDDFHARVPDDPGDMFWTHLELLRKCKFVAVRQDAKASGVKNENSTPRMIIKNQGKKTVKPVPSMKNEFANISPSNNRTGNNGQIQLWQFLLEILTDKNYKDIIKWNGGNGEFKLCQPEVVAYLWGVRKNKPSMNYEKLSRALRYYYDGDMISKVHGKRFVYKFVCNLKQLLGYDAQELSDLVNE